MSENANPGGGSQSGQVNKKRRWVSREFLRDHQQVFFRVRSGFFGEALEESCIDNVAVKRRRARGKRVETSSIASSSQAQEQRELLEEIYEIEIDNKNEDESTPCSLAAARGHLEVVKLLLDKDPNAIFDADEDDNTPLHLAAANKHSETVRFLLEQGASVHKRNSKKWTALDCAAAAGAFSCAELLLKNDSPVDPRDRQGGDLSLVQI